MTFRNYLVRKFSDDTFHNIKATQQPQGPDYVVLGLVDSDLPGENFTLESYILDDRELFRPVLLPVKDRPKISAAEKRVGLLANLRAKRDELLKTTIWRAERQRQQIELGIERDLSDIEMRSWMEYWQALRDLPKTATDLTKVVWPTQPLTLKK